MTRLFGSNGVSRVCEIDGHEVVVTLHPDMSISFRKKGKRTVYNVHMSLCMELALCKSIEKEYNEKLERFNERKKLGYKGLKQPKKPVISGAMLRKSVAIVLR